MCKIENSFKLNVDFSLLKFYCRISLKCVYMWWGGVGLGGSVLYFMYIVFLEYFLVIIVFIVDDCLYVSYVI